MYQEKIDAVIALLKERNVEIGEGNPGYLDVEKVPTLIKAYDARKDEDLIKLNWDAILDILDPAYTVKPLVRPKLLAEKIAKIFRNLGKPEEAEVNLPEGKRPVSTKKAEKMTPRELVECFDPEEVDNPVGVRLKAMSKGEPFIVFSDGRLVDTATTLKLLLEVKQGYSGVQTVTVGDKVKPVYKLGELPDAYADENPLYIGRPLRPDGTCDQTGRSWAGVDINIRQFMRLILEMGYSMHHSPNKSPMISGNIPPMLTIDQAHDAIDRALQPDALKKLRQRYAAVSVKFDELEKLGKLPRLQIALKINKGGPTRPFDGGRQIQWAAPAEYRPQLNNPHGTFSNHIAKKY